MASSLVTDIPVQNITIMKGDGEIFSLTIVQNSAAVDLTGYSIWYTAKTKFKDLDADAVIQKTIGDGITVINAALGAIELAFTNADTDDLLDRVYTLFHDMQIQKLPADPHTQFTGVLTITPEVTESVL